MVQDEYCNLKYVRQLIKLPPNCYERKYYFMIPINIKKKMEGINTEKRIIDDKTLKKVI